MKFRLDPSCGGSSSVEDARSIATPPPAVRRRRRSILRRSLLLAVALLALTVFFISDPRPTSADHDYRATLWSATLTTAGYGIGCLNDLATQSKCSTPSRLSDDDFVHAGITYSVWHLGNTGDSSSVAFTASFDPAPPAGLRDVATVHVNGVAFDLSDARFGGENNDNEANPELGGARPDSSAGMDRLVRQ